MAAAGCHPLLLVGPTGAGKSLLARCLPGLLPPLAPAEALAVAEAYARAGQAPPAGRPVRIPGAGLSPVRLLGGRRPGEVQLARHGVMILDDLAALGHAAQRALCEALDREGEAPSFLLCAALLPCSCGGPAHSGAACGCPPARTRRHLARVDGALLDRFDVCTEVERPPRRELDQIGEAGAAVAARIASAHRFRAGRPAPASPLDASCRALLAAAVERLEISPRAVVRAQVVARTIADLAGSPEVRTAHLAEAVQYRRSALDRQGYSLT